jgi:hypothetical protein
MADFSRDQLMQALRNADAAGDAAAARAIAQRLSGMSAAPARPTTASLIASGEDLRTGAQRREDESLGLSSELPYGMPPNKVGEMVAGFVPGVGVAEGIFGKQVAFDDPDSMMPTGVKDVPGIAGNVRQGNYGTAALQTVGLVPDVFAGAAAAKIAPDVARLAPEVGRGVKKATLQAKSELAKTGREIAAMPGALAERVKPQAVVPLTEDMAAPPQGLAFQSPAAAKGEERLYNMMLESGWTPERIEAKLRQLGPKSTLADLEPFGGIANVTAQEPKGMKRALRVLGGRDVGAESRMLATVDNTLSNENFYESLDKLKTQRSAAAQPLRQQAMSTTRIIKDDGLQRILETPEGQEGLRMGAKIARLEEARTGIPVPKSETWYHGANFDDPNIKIVETPTLRMLDAMKQGFDAKLAPFRDKYTGELRGLGPYEVEIDKARKQVVDVLRSQSDDYAKYLNSWADDSQQMDALARGRKILNNDPEVTAKSLRRSSPEQMEFVRIGLARALKDKIRENPQAAIRYFDKSVTQDKMRAAFPSKAEWNLFRRQALRESATRATFLRNTKGAQTAERVAGKKSLETEPSALPEAAGMAFDLGTKNILGATRRGLNWAARKIADRPTPPVAEEISSVVHNVDPVTQERMIQRFKARSMPTMRPRGTDELDAFEAELDTLP